MTSTANTKRRPARPAAAASDARGDLAAAPLSRKPGTPLHHQIFLILNDRIQSGQWGSGEFLPSEGDLARQFQVSRVTVRAALAAMESSGLIERRQGIGTSVRVDIGPSPLHAPMAEMLTHIQDVRRLTTITVLEYGFERAPPHVQALFGAAPDDLFQRVVRLRSTTKGPLFHVMTFLPEPIGRLFSREDLALNSLYDLMQREGIVLASGRQTVSAALADPVLALRLEVEIGSPLLQIRRLHLDENRRPVEYLEILAPPSRFELHISLDGGELAK